MPRAFRPTGDFEAHGYRVVRIAERQLLEHRGQTLARVQAALAR